MMVRLKLKTGKHVIVKDFVLDSRCGDEIYVTCTDLFYISTLYKVSDFDLTDKRTVRNIYKVAPQYTIKTIFGENGV